MVQLVTGKELAQRLNLNRSRITQMRQEGKIQYADSVRRLYDLRKAVVDYDRNTCPGKALRHQADKLDRLDAGHFRRERVRVRRGPMSS
jgi:hypothetical protein